MKIKFTLSSFFMVMLLATGAFAQINTMTINSPASIAGTYDVAVASYGDQSGMSITGDIVLGMDGDTTDSNMDGTPGTETDGCEPLTNGGMATGNVVIVDRGECFFGTKSESVENAGGIVALICNNDALNPDALTTPGAGENGEGEGTGILTVMASFNDCQMIKMALENEAVNATFSFEFVVDGEIIWGNQAGEGDFNGGTNGWTIMNEDAQGDGWRWVDPAEGYNIFGAAINSPTANNGYMHIDSWNLGNPNQGLCDPCNGGIISPTIDLSGQNLSGLFVEFEQLYVQFFQRVFVIASPDGGTTWRDTFPVNQLTITNSFEGNTTVRVALPGYENEESVTLQFYKTEAFAGGGYYYWAIDDVRLINDSYPDMRSNFNFFATSPAYKMPLSQSAEIPFLIDIFNEGNETATNVQVDVEIFRDGAMVFNTTNNYPDIGPWSDNQNTVFPETYTPDAEGFYTGRYIAKADGDTRGGNDTIPFFFEVTPNLLSPLPSEDEFVQPPVFDPITSGSTWAPGSNSFTLNYAAGHIFYTPNGSGHTVSTVTFGVDDDPTRNGVVNVWLYAWLRNDDDNSGTFEIDANNTLLVGTAANGAQIINPAFGSQRVIDVQMAAADVATGDPLFDNMGNPVPVELRDDQLYVTVLATNSNNDTQIGLLGFDSDSPNVQTRNWNVNAANLALDSLGSNRLCGTAMVQTSSGDFQEIDGTTFTGGTWGINELYIEYQIDPLMVGTEDLNDAQDISVYPNPATDVLFVDLNLDAASPVTIELMSIDGRLIQSYNYNNILTQQVRLDVADVETGVYHVNIRTEEGFTSKRVIIAE